MTMLGKINMRTKTRVIIPALLAVVMMLSMAPAAFAHNEYQGKAINVLGYEYVNTTTVKIFFDKNIPTTNITVNDFTIQKTGESAKTINSFTRANGSGWTNAYAPTGSTVTLTLGSALSYDTTYHVTVDGGLTANNGLTVGYYLHGDDVAFDMHTPDSSGNYDTGDTTFAFIPVDNTDTDFSMNVMAISSIPIDTSSFTLSDVKLQKWNGSVYADCIRDTTFDTSETTDAESYTAQINNAHTCLFLPMTLASSTPMYDLLSLDGDYQLSIPSSIEGVNGDTFSTVTFQFDTEDTH